jgi:hypothetical protein
MKKIIFLCFLIIFCEDLYSQDISVIARKKPFTSGASTTHYFDTLSYYGTGSEQEITVPTISNIMMVTIAGANPDYKIWKTSTMGTDSAKQIAYTAALQAGMVTLGTNKITVYADTATNQSGTLYHVCVWGENSGVWAVGKYIGNGTSKTITTGINAKFIMIALSVAGSGRASFKTGGDSSFAFITTSGIVQTVTAMGETSFDIGNAANVNSNGETHFYAVFDTVAGYCSQFAYAGNATAARSISVTDYKPDLVWLFPKNSYEKLFRSSMMAANYSSYWTNVYQNFGGITSFNNSGFVVDDGGNANPNGVMVHGICWRKY